MRPTDASTNAAANAAADAHKTAHKTADKTATADAGIFGWDIGGAHVKACWLVAGQVRDVVQWPCPLWLGLDHLQRVLQAALARWPGLGAARHAVTMTGEMADLFADREDGVRRIAAEIVEHLGAPSAQLANIGAPNAQPSRLHFFAGDAGWCDADTVGDHWAQVASANWLASARHAALALLDQARTSTTTTEGVLVDIGSTTTDLIAFRGGTVLTRARSDAQRLATGELVYHGVVRTPLCALARRVPWQGATLNVMNEFFATTADVYRVTGELDDEHDQHPSADNAAKTVPASQQRLARMIGLDQRDGSPADWRALAEAWRAEQVAELRGQLARVMVMHGLGPKTVLVTAGCGDFLVPDLARELADDLAHDPASAGTAGAKLRCVRYADAVSRRPPHSATLHGTAWAQVCAPSVAVAALLLRDCPADTQPHNPMPTAPKALEPC